MLKILHVTSGNPKKHPGGLSKYCIDLYKAQVQIGYDARIIFAGKLNDDYYYKIKKINNEYFRLDGALPVSTIFGVDKPKRYMKSYDKTNFRLFFLKHKFNVLHVHSIQGFPIEFFEVAKEMNIKLIFTTHDYYCFCFKYNLFDYNGNICQNYNEKKCVLCSKQNALHEKIQKIKQNPISDLKISKFAKKIAYGIKVKNDSNYNVINTEISSEELMEFNSLRQYYLRILNLFDVIHCNSNLTKIIYSSFCPNLNYIVEPVTHSNLTLSKKNDKKKKELELHIGYYGGPSEQKGFKILNEALDIVEGKYKIKIFTEFYGGFYKTKDSYSRHFHDRLEGEKLSLSFEKLDLVIVPSQWYETFGFLTIESLAKNIPVIVSDVVGSKDLVLGIDSNAVFTHNSKEELANKIIYFSKNDNYYNYVNKITLPQNILDFKTHIINIVEKMCSISNDVRQNL